MNMMSYLPTQDNVKSTWVSDDVKVTCIVVCYNHQDYIFDCLKGIITQKTDFAFKIVIYDDFSPDGTRSILKAFEKQYPNIIDVYYAEFNHRGVARQEEHIDKIQGEYVALCEGDDFWIDSSKLKKQYQESCKHNALFCIHPAIIFFQDNKSEDLFCYYGNTIRKLPQKLIFEFKNQFAPTASYFIKKEKYLEYIVFRRRLDGGPGDFFLEAVASDRGVIYLPDVMSVYRRGGEGTYSAMQVKSSVDSIKNDVDRWSRNLQSLLEFNPRLEKYIRSKKMLVEIDGLLRMHDKVTDNEEYMEKAIRLLKELGPLDETV
ncbi:glycosyltransferase family 2 protein [Halomonas sp. HNIBRBA4712]|uniref:glycosyltransferase family 2 protein n=1 Tax=Halomonas sp. HNIBRBA4712 TaxID=3373087 RepID=UPI003745864A